jgi:hypothetical protein
VSIRRFSSSKRVRYLFRIGREFRESNPVVKARPPRKNPPTPSGGEPPLQHQLETPYGVEKTLELLLSESKRRYTKKNKKQEKSWALFAAVHGFDKEFDSRSPTSALQQLSFNFHVSSCLILLLYIDTKEEVVVDPVDNLESSAPVR